MRNTVPVSYAVLPDVVTQLVTFARISGDDAGIALVTFPAMPITMPESVVTFAGNIR